MRLRFLGATGEVTGSCFLLERGQTRVLIECGLIQGSPGDERHNADEFAFDPGGIDAVVVTHAHIDHSGRLPLLVKRGFKGAVYTHRATVDLCEVMLADAAYLQEKEAQWQQRSRRPGEQRSVPLYDREDALRTQQRFKGIEYGRSVDIASGIRLTLHDAGHILGSAIVKMEVDEGSRSRTIVFSGDLGHRGAPILRDPENLERADLVVMESTYGGRMHRSWEATWREMGDVITSARSGSGNILVPAFTVGRTQELLYVFNRNFHEWDLDRWRIFLDSPMAIKATDIYARHAKVYDHRARDFESEHGELFALPNLHMSESPHESMVINRIRSGAIIIAGSGMCTGGRIKHHLKHNVWRKEAHVMIVGFQARGTPGRALVDGADQIRLWGEPVNVAASVHTIGGLSAHADQQGLVDWYGGFSNRPPVCLVHGEPESMQALAARLRNAYDSAGVTLPEYGLTIDL